MKLKHSKADQYVFFCFVRHSGQTQAICTLHWDWIVSVLNCIEQGATAGTLIYFKMCLRVHYNPFGKFEWKFYASFQTLWMGMGCGWNDWTRRPDKFKPHHERILIGQTAAFLLYKHSINKPSGKFCCGWWSTSSHTWRRGPITHWLHIWHF